MIARDILVETYWRSVVSRMTEALGVHVYWSSDSPDRGAIVSASHPPGVSYRLDVSLVDDAEWHVVPCFDRMLPDDLWPMRSFAAIGLAPPRWSTYRRTQEAQYVARRLAHMWQQAALLSTQIAHVLDDRRAHRAWLRHQASRLDLVDLQNLEQGITASDALKLHNRPLYGTVRDHPHIVVRLMRGRVDVTVQSLPDTSRALDAIIFAARDTRLMQPERTDGAE